MINKICLITQDFYPMKGGIASYLIGVYNKFFRGVKFEVIVPDCLGNSEDFNSLPFKVHRITFYPFNLKDSKRGMSNLKILEVLEGINPDVILFGYLRSHPEVGIEYKKSHPHTIIGLFAHAKEMVIDSCIIKQNHNGTAHRGYSEEEAKFYKSILNSVDVIFSVSKFTKRILREQGVLSKILILNPPIKEKQIVDKNLARDKINVNKSSQVLLSVGRLIKRKGQDKIVRLMPYLNKEYPSLKYIIVGSGPELESLNFLIKKLELEDKVRVIGSIGESDKDLFYSACDIFVLPCDFIEPNEVEGLGIVFLEASLFGKPLIGGNTGGVPEVVLDGETGLLVDPKSEEDILCKIRMLLNNESLRDKLGKNGRERVLKLFSDQPNRYLINFLESLNKNHAQNNAGKIELPNEVIKQGFDIQSVIDESAGRGKQ